MNAATVIAGLFNSQRTKTSDRWWTALDFHPAHSQKRSRGKSGRQVLRDVSGWFSPGEIEWAEGYGPEAF
jgi:hypothetical protein